MLKLLADAHPDLVTKLSYQYRMNEEIAQLSNDIVYGGALRCANESVRSQRLALPGFPKSFTLEWLNAAIDPQRPVVFIDTDLADGSDGFRPLEQTQAGKTVNNTEIKLVQEVLSSLLLCGVPADDVGVICPFRAQVSTKQRVNNSTRWEVDLTVFLLRSRSLTRTQPLQRRNIAESRSAPSIDTKAKRKQS
jgi:DNA replication ATP-dependent helicase Dna2